MDKEKHYFNNSKLRARIFEMDHTCSSVAKCIPMTKTTFSLKINGKREFTHGEICKICDLLEIKSGDIPQYFFNQRV